VPVFLDAVFAAFLGGISNERKRKADQSRSDAQEGNGE
jgi:hypothetical protein